MALPHVARHAPASAAATAPSPGADPAARTAGLLSLLRARRLDRTLTSEMPVQSRSMAPLDLLALDQAIGGGVPRGQVSEIIGPSSSGRTSLAWAALAAATRRGEWVALVDTFDRFDPERAAAAGIVLSQVLWVRGQALSKTAGAIDPAWVPGGRGVSGPGTMLERTIDRAIKSLNLVVQSGVCTLVVLDLIDVPGTCLARIPRSTWLRIQRVIEGSDTAVVLLAASPVAKSAGGVSMATGAVLRHAEGGDPEPGRRGERGAGVRWKGVHDRARRLGGLASGVRATSARGLVGEWPLMERINDLHQPNSALGEQFSAVPTERPL